MTTYRRRRQFIVAPNEDLVTRLGEDQLTVDLVRTPNGLVAYARPFSNSSISEAAWRGTILERRKWQSLIREAVIESVGAMPKRMEVGISRGPPWLERMLKSRGHGSHTSWPSIWSGKGIEMPADLKWSKPFNFFDVMSKAYREHGVRMPGTPREFYGDMINNILGRMKHEYGPPKADSIGEYIPINRPAATGVVEAMSELVWYEFNRPVWFIDKTMTELLLTAKIDDDLSGIHFPHESVYLCFEAGTQIEGFDLRSITLFVPRSEQTIKMIHRATGDNRVVPQFLNKLIGTWTDCLDGPEYELLQSGFIRSRNRLYNWRKYTEPAPDSDAVGVDARELGAMRRSMQIAAAAMLYYSARPELVSEYKLPRSQRYEFKGERSGFRRMTLPGVKHIRPHGAEIAGVHGTGAPKAPHYRGWVMRVLRDPRYTRNEDGSFKSVLVPPTAIHPELMD